MRHMCRAVRNEVLSRDRAWSPLRLRGVVDSSTHGPLTTRNVYQIIMCGIEADWGNTAGETMKPCALVVMEKD